ncbi:DUF58 domain-containing protein [Paenibacillaceae bacterium]|nr:DUF58 domain-containing protein [Paenibacillaceae bacterium]
MVLLAAVSGLVVAAGYALGAGTAVLLLVNGLLVAAAALDLSLLPRRRSLRFERSLPKQADIGQPFEVKITALAERPVSVRLELQDDLPQSFGLPDRLCGTIQGRSAEWRYQTAGSERGVFAFRFLRIRLLGPLGLWQKQTKLAMEQTVNIYPDLSGVRGILGSMQNHLTLEGKRIYRRERSGTELHAIREYTPDDDPRYINWRATARTGTLMTSVFRPERGKIVTVMIDCGRMMGIELNGRTKLDAVLEAALSLAAVALKQGDKVALLAFSSKIKLYVPPGSGLTHLQTLTAAVFDLQSDFVEASYSNAMQFLLKVQKKRSMTVLFSDMDNYMFDEAMRPLLQRMSRQHVVLLIGLRDEVLHRWTVAKTTGRRQAFIRSLSHKLALDRQAYTAQINAMGIDAIDVAVDDLAWTAVNRYLDVKSRDAL